MRLFLTSLFLCGILVVPASAAYRYVPRTVIHNGCYHTIWVKQWYPKVTVYPSKPHWDYKAPVKPTPVKPTPVKPTPKPLVIINPYCEN